MADDEKKAEKKKLRQVERKKKKRALINRGKAPVAAAKEDRAAKKRLERREEGKRQEKIERKNKKKIERTEKQKSEKKIDRRTERKKQERLEKKAPKKLEQKKAKPSKKKKVKSRKQTPSATQVIFPMQRLLDEENSATQFASAAAIDLLKIRNGSFVVDFDGVPFHASFQRSQEKRLFVLLDGVFPGQIAEHEALERRPWRSLLPGSVLHVSDPKLALSADASQGWYVGTQDRNYTEYLAQLIDRVADQLRLTRSEIIFYANSAGGFAALMCARLLPGSHCIVVNPQIDIARSGSAPKREQFAKRFAAEASFEALEKKHRSRFSVLEAYPSADKLPLTVYAQNTKDVKHFRDHYEVFCAAYSAPKEGGISANGRILTLLFEYAGGHGAEPLPLVRPLIAEALAFFEHSRRRKK